MLPVTVVEAAHLLLLFRLTKTRYALTFRWAKNAARGVRFLLCFNMYLVLAQGEQVSVFGTCPFQLIESTRHQLIVQAIPINRQPLKTIPG